MIDYNARQQLKDQQRTETLLKGMTETIKAVVENNNQSSKSPSLVIKHEEDQTLVDSVRKIGDAIALVYKQITKPIALPKVLQVKGEVQITKQPNIKVDNFKDLEKYFISLEQKLTVWAQAAAMAPQPKIEFPKFEFPKVDGTVDPKLIELLDGLNEKISKLSTQQVKFPKTVSIDNFPLQLTPQPVTNIWLNPSDGFVKTTSATVGTTATTLPSYGQLFSRRSLQIFNNSNNTIYLGGSDVTTSNGIPVLGNSYSNIFDAGYNCIIYGIGTQGGNNVRCLEISKDQSANVQE